MREVRRKVVLRNLNSVFRAKSRYAIYDSETGELLYHAAYEISCMDKAKRMGWEIVPKAKEVQQ